MRCGGPGALSKCVPIQLATGCTPKTCEELDIECGQAGDGCGGILNCGTCPAGQQCGGPGAFARCVSASVLGPDGGACVPKTCDDYRAEGKDCGLQSDGCGDIIDCGGCVDPAFCGGGGPSKCAPAGGNPCVPKTCADYPGKCGPQPDGCGGVTENCGTCTPPQVCGGGSVPSVCGGGVVTGPDGGACTPIETCGPKQCGKIADGCGGILDCGTDNCAPGEVCGGAGVPNECGTPPCTPIEVCPAGLNCGSIADGCGGLVQCGPPDACTPPEICGGGGIPNVCGGGSVVADGGGPCQPITTCLPNQCGPIADGCGGILDCGTCANGMACGSGGTPNVCPGTCIPRTQADCATLGFNCGYIADGCGGPPIQCGATCPDGGICGLDSPNVCSSGGVLCKNFCQHQATCTPTTKTRVTGKVYAPNGKLPIPGALVYVPNGSMTPPYGLTPIPSGVQNGTCEQCNQTASGEPLVSTRSNWDGSFTLEDVPAGISFPLVIQLGKWRKLITVGPIQPCQTAVLDGSSSNRPLPRLPTRQNENGMGVDNIPLVAISTGSVDGLECVFHKLGIETTQFSKGNESGRIRLYRNASGGSAGARIGNGTTPSATTLWNTQDNLDQYDAIVFGCGGPPGDWATGNTAREAQARLRQYADKGGRVFATHYQYVWLYNNTAGTAPYWQNSVNWDVRNERYSTDNGGTTTQPRYGGYWDGEITAGPPGSKRDIFARWLNAPGVQALQASDPPRIRITEARNNADRNVHTAAEEWITRYADGANGKAVLHYTFNTPLGAPAANQCGRVLFSDFHVTIGDTSSSVFPNHCNSNNGELTNQEKVLAFFLFDLTSCIETPEPPTCKPRTCADYPPNTCGQQSDGCGGLTENCGTCPTGQTCGGGGVPNQCGAPSPCVPKTCADYNATCGEVPDGCGRVINCGDCPPGQTCGGGGVAYQCGAPSCTPRTCEELGVACGDTGDGCGDVIHCGDCPPGQTCGGGGVPNQCGAPACTPLTECPHGKNCGEIPDGCGGVVACGTCPDGETCGGGGAPNVCGAASCSPKTCEDVGAQCGMISDQCGGALTCGTCPGEAFCNEDNLCVPPVCQPKTCAELGAECGRVADGCGGLTPDCGECPPDTICGGGGIPNKCGKNPCTPATCADLQAQCGRVSDGCGGLTPDCGTCEGLLSCSNGKCIQACTPRTCEEADAECGPISDGCGGIVDCGPCPPGKECGYNNVANKCGSGGPK